MFGIRGLGPLLCYTHLDKYVKHLNLNLLFRSRSRVLSLVTTCHPLLCLFGALSCIVHTFSSQTQSQVYYIIRLMTWYGTFLSFKNKMPIVTTKPLVQYILVICPIIMSVALSLVCSVL